MFSAILWSLDHHLGYGVYFPLTTKGFMGNPFKHIFLLGVDYVTCSPHAPNIPIAAFALFEMMYIDFILSV